MRKLLAWVFCLVWVFGSAGSFSPGLAGSYPDLNGRDKQNQAGDSLSPRIFPAPSPQPTHIVSLPTIAALMAQVTPTAVYSLTAGLSGEHPLLIGGSPYTLLTRQSTSGEPIQKATQYAYETLDSLGLETSYHTFSYGSSRLRNVIGEQPGVGPEECIFMVTAHLDDMPSGSLAPGADDNASGSAGVLLAARLLSGYSHACTLRYVLFTGEEQGLLGSKAYAGDVRSSGENVTGVLNLDMIGYDSKGGPVIELYSSSAIPASTALAERFVQVVSAYNLALAPVLLKDGHGYYSDNYSFWLQGFPAILVIESHLDFNPNYHTTRDTVDKLDLDIFTEIVRAAVGTTAHLAGMNNVQEYSGLIFLPLLQGIETTP